MAAPPTVAFPDGILFGTTLQPVSVLHARVIFENGARVAGLASPALTGTPTAPDPDSADNSGQISNTRWVRAYATGVLAGYAEQSGSLSEDNLLIGNADGKVSDYGQPVSWVLDRANHTGTQALTTITGIDALPADATKYLNGDGEWSVPSGTSHTQNSDDYLDQGGIYEVTAAELRAHLDNAAKHRLIRDATNSTTALWSSSKTKAYADAIGASTVTHERGGLEADVSAYSGVVKISGGATSALSTGAAGESVLASATAANVRTAAGLVIGTDVQAYDADLAGIAGLSFVNGDIIYYNSSMQRLAKGTDGEVLKLASGVPSWGTVTALLPDASVAGTGRQEFAGINFTDAVGLTIGSGVIAIGTASLYRLDTEGDASSDDLDTISGGANGDVIYVYPESGSRTIVLKHATGNIRCQHNADITLDDAWDVARLQFRGSYWMATAGTPPETTGTSATFVVGTAGAERELVGWDANGNAVSLEGLVIDGEYEFASMITFATEPDFPADSIDAITEIASSIKAGDGTKLQTVTTPGANGTFATFDSAGKLQAASTPPITADGASAFTAFQEQFGVNLKDPTTLTISAGVVTATQGWHKIATQAAASLDDLDTVSGLAVTGNVVLLQAASGSQTVRIKHGTGNIVCGGEADFDLDDANKIAVLVYNGSAWSANLFSGSVPSSPAKTGSGAIYVSADAAGTSGRVAGWAADGDVGDAPTILNLGAATELTIATGAVTITQSHHTIDTEGDASTDDLVTISGGTEGDHLWIRPADGARTVVVKHGSGNIVTRSGADYTLDEEYKTVHLRFSGSTWYATMESDQTATDSAAIHDNVAGEIAAITLKATPVSADVLLIEDSADSNNKKRVTFGSLGTDANAIHDNVAGEISALTQLNEPATNDMLIIEDASASYAKRKISVFDVGIREGGRVLVDATSAPTTHGTGTTLVHIFPEDVILQRVWVGVYTWIDGTTATIDYAWNWVDGVDPGSAQETDATGSMGEASRIDTLTPGWSIDSGGALYVTFTFTTGGSNGRGLYVGWQATPR